MVPVAVGGPRLAVATGVAVAVVSALTRYPLGLVKVLPFIVHSAGDYLAAALLVIAPFVVGYPGADRGLPAFYIVAGVACWP